MFDIKLWFRHSPEQQTEQTLWFDRGVTKVKHLKDEHNNFLSLAELQQKYSLKVCLLNYFGLVSALKSLCIHQVAFYKMQVTIP